MAEYFDFGEAAMPDVLQDHTENHEVPTIVATGRNLCPAHGTDSTDGCICQGFMDEFDVAEPIHEEFSKTEWNPDFSNWIPRYSKPEHACEYCRSRHLECFITYEGQAGCSPCNALFRPCSFNQPDDNKQKNRHLLDTLDVVSEDTAHLFGGLTSKKPMRSLGHTGPIEHDDDEERPRKGSVRFPRSAVKILKDWMDEHIDHQYPTEEDKEELKNKTGLTASQISNWMANTRRRQKARPKRSASPSIRPSTEAINIPAGRTWESLNPFERWKHSPPENEPAPLTAIAKAVENFDPPEPPSLSSSLGCRNKKDSNGSSGSFSIFRAPSTASLETGFTNASSGSAHSYGSAWSYGSRNSLTSFNSLNSNGKKERRRRRRVPPRTPKMESESSSPRLFQCTFCTDKFKSKYDWSRHEKTLHLSLEKWICAPLGDVITRSSSGQRECVYCDVLDPSPEHLETHNHAACEEKGLESRTFYRKDHLRQHLRLMHNCKMTAGMESWKSEATFIKSRCGFCGAEFTKWQDRVDHLAKEFRNGKQMKDWKGCRGLDAHVAAQVTNSMPPYLIGNESKSPFPFSASNKASMAHTLYLTQPDLEFAIPGLPTTAASGTNSFTAQDWSNHNTLQASGYSSEGCVPSIVPHASTTSPGTTWTSQLATPPQPSPHSSNPYTTCWEILTLRLGRYARQQAELLGPANVTDDMLQQHARRILYDDDDSWNQTAADNPEWLHLFKKAHGITQAGPRFDKLDALEELGVMGDLAVFEDLTKKGWDGLMGECIPEMECSGKGGLCVGENGEVEVDLAAQVGGGVQDCYRFAQLGHVPEPLGLPEAGGGLSGQHMEVVEGHVDGAQVMRWDEAELGMGLDLSVNMGMGIGA